MIEYTRPITANIDSYCLFYRWLVEQHYQSSGEAHNCIMVFSSNTELLNFKKEFDL